MNQYIVELHYLKCLFLQTGAPDLILPNYKIVDEIIKFTT